MKDRNRRLVWLAVVTTMVVAPACDLHRNEEDRVRSRGYAAMYDGIKKAFR